MSTLKEILAHTSTFGDDRGDVLGDTGTREISVCKIFVEDCIKTKPIFITLKKDIIYVKLAISVFFLR